MEGHDRSLLNSPVDGSLRTVTDGSHHPKEHVATAAVHVEAEDGSTLTLVLWTPGEKWDLQSHRAELSGHFAVATVLEFLCDWVKGEGKVNNNVGVVLFKIFIQLLHGIMMIMMIMITMTRY